MFKEEQLTREIIGIAMAVHRQLGPGFKENVYHRALLIALRKRRHLVESEKAFQVFLDGELVGNFRVDLLVASKVIVEIKAIDFLMPRIYRTQLVSYLKASHIEVGLLINFGKPSLEVKRIAHFRNPSKSSQNLSESTYV